MITVYNLDRSKQGLVDALDTNGTDRSTTRRTYDGLEVNFSARLPKGGSVFGGWSADKNVDVACELDNPNFASDPSTTTPWSYRYCDQSALDMPFRSDFKLTGAYPLPFDMQVGATYASYAGDALRVTWSVPANLFPGGRTQSVTVDLIPPGTKFLERWNQVDLSLRKLFRCRANAVQRQPRHVQRPQLQRRAERDAGVRSGARESNRNPSAAPAANVRQCEVLSLIRRLRSAPLRALRALPPGQSDSGGGVRLQRPGDAASRRGSRSTGTWRQSSSSIARPCHRAGEAAPFSLLTYADVRSRATQIAKATADRYMPPWKPEPGYGEFARARRLTMAQIGTIQRWVEQGAAEGNPSDLLRPP